MSAKRSNRPAPPAGAAEPFDGPSASPPTSLDNTQATPDSSQAAAAEAEPANAPAGAAWWARAASLVDPRATRMRLITLIVAGAAVGIMLYVLLFRFVDDSLNGAFVDWFFNTFVSTWEVDYQTGTTYNLVFNPTGAKEFFLRLGLVFVLVLVVACALAARWYARRQVKPLLKSASELMEFYLKHDADAREVFPAGYEDIALVATDIKAETAAHERTLRDEAQRRSDLITYLAHDLKTPLTSVIGYLSLLDEIPEMPCEQRCRYVGITLDKAKRLERLINEFFDITRYNLSHIELEVEPVDLSYLLVQMADEFYPLLAAHGNTVALSVEGRTVSAEEPGPALMIEADPGRLARVLNNLLKNAIAYSHEGTEIAVAVERMARDAAVGTMPPSLCTDPAADDGSVPGAQAHEPDAVRITVSDEGATIPSHKLKAIFDKFFRLDEARTSATGGAGLGLAIAREIVELHGGTIGAASEAGRTTFTVELPLRQG